MRRKLALFLQQTVGFRLALALYDDPVFRDQLIRSLSGEMTDAGLTILTLDLCDPSNDQTLLERVKILVDDARVTFPDQRIAVMVINLERRVDYTPELARPGSVGVTFLETANLHREHFQNVCPAPIVIWMTELLERAFVRYSPDLWHWRSHVFDFRTRREDRKMKTRSQSNVLRSNDYRLHPVERLRRLEEELAAYRKADARHDEARVLNAIGLARLDSGDFRFARQDFEAALSIARKLRDKRAQGVSLGNLGIAYRALGNTRKAIDCYEQALAIARKSGNRRSQGNALGNLGNAYTGLNEARKAIKFHNQALVIDREIGNARGEAADLGNLGIAHKALGDNQRAIEFFEQALSIARSLGDRQSEAKALGNIGKCLRFFARSA